MQKKKKKNSAISLFIFIISCSHELRTPLNSVIGFNQLLLVDSDLTDSQRDHISSALHSAESLLEVINNIIEYSRLETSDISLSETEFNVYDFVLDHLLESMSFKAQEKGVEIIVDYNPNVCPPILIGDGYRLRRVLFHLVDNALKATERGGSVIVRIYVEKKEQLFDESESLKEEYVSFSIVVQDTGRGIPNEKRQILFRPFSQIEERHKHSGTGMFSRSSNGFVFFFFF